MYIIALIAALFIIVLNLTYGRTHFEYTWYDGVSYFGFFLLGFGLSGYTNLDSVFFTTTLLLGLTYFIKGHPQTFAKSIFWYVLGLMIFRTFLFEPYSVPTPSMEPTISVQNGSKWIGVNKFAYGGRLFYTQQRIWGKPGDGVNRGDIVTFRYPLDPSTYYVKRVIGVPGDTVQYFHKTKKIAVNGDMAEWTLVKDGDSKEFMETLSGTTHKIRIETPKTMTREQFLDMENQAIMTQNTFQGCTSNSEVLTCKVPAGKYWVMGDNRDNSYDSRYWGYVTDDQMVGPSFVLFP